MDKIIACFLVLGLLLSGCPQEREGSPGVLEPPVLEECTDSDGGKDEFTYGTATLGSEAESDSCTEDGKVLEYYCSFGAIESEAIACPAGHGCQGGECVELNCFDTDGGNVPGAKGTVQYDGEQYTDYCTEGGSVHEYYCGEGVAEEEVACAAGEVCEDGRCTEGPSCTDTDGGKELHEGGTVTAGGRTYEDYCLGTYVVYEYYCENGAKKAEQMSCPEGEYCVDGVCAEEEEHECEDTDGGKKTWKKGTVTYWSGGEEYTETDKCYDDYSVLEVWCTDEGTVGFGILECESGERCEDGECVD